MRNQRIYTHQALALGETISLDKTSSHHLANVLRLKPGAQIILFNGDNKEHKGHIATIERNTVSVQIGRTIEISRESPLKITLIQGISRSSRMDYSLQKSVELGVSSIVPVMTSRTQVKLNDDRLAKKMAHWGGVILSACEQSGRTIIPQLHSCTTLAQWLNTELNFSLKLLLDPAAKLTLPSLEKPTDDICILIGSEGGLSDDEIRHCTQQGFTGIVLGPRILRTETASLVALSSIQTLWGDFS